MRKNITYNITKKVRVDTSPFKIAIYVFKDRNRILIEDLETGKAVETNSYSINDYIKLGKTETDWERSFDNTYIRYHEGKPEYFMSHYPESNRYANLTIDIVKKMCPLFTNKEVMNPTTNRRVTMIDNEITPEKKEEKTYNFIFKNVKDFEVPNFKLEMVESERTSFVNEDFTPLKIPQITCRVPIFQVFSILRPKIHIYEYEQKAYFDYKHNLTVMKMDNKFYRFPYGNTSDSDQLCLGGYSVPRKNTQPDSIQDLSYAQIITTVFNGDYNPHVKFNNQIVTTFDINWIREKINKDDFEVSFMDVLFYISQCETLEEVNKKLFILSPNIPKPILEFESKLLKILDPARAEEAQATFEGPIVADDETEATGPEPARMNFRFVAPPVRETDRFRVPGDRFVVPDPNEFPTQDPAGFVPGHLREERVRHRQNANGDWVTMPDRPGNETIILPINNGNATITNYDLYIATTATNWTTAGNQTYYTDGTTGRAQRAIVDDVEHPRTAVDVEVEQRAIQHQEAILRLHHETENNTLEPSPEEYPDPRTTEEIYDDLVTERVIEQALHPQVSDHDRRLMEEISRSIELRRENIVLPTADEQGAREIGEVIGGTDLATNPHIQIFHPHSIPTIVEIQEEIDNRPVPDIPIQIVDYPADLIRVDGQLQTTDDIQTHAYRNFPRVDIRIIDDSQQNNQEIRAEIDIVENRPIEVIPVTINVTNLRTNEVQAMNFNPDTMIITEQENGVQENDTNRETVTETQRVQPS
jgi:hypothetical protein